MIYSILIYQQFWLVVHLKLCIDITESKRTRVLDVGLYLKVCRTSSVIIHWYDEYVISDIHSLTFVCFVLQIRTNNIEKVNPFFNMLHFKISDQNNCRLLNSSAGAEQHSNASRVGQTEMQFAKIKLFKIQ